MSTTTNCEVLDAGILAFLKAASRNEAYTARELHEGLGYDATLEVITSRLLALTERKLVQRLHLQTTGLILYKIGPSFLAVHFTPLFFGAPEWRVEHRDGEQLALCKSELHAKLIANALNGD